MIKLLGKVCATKALHESMLWPNNLSKKIYTGFTDQDLELVCDLGLRGFDQSLPYKSGPWLYWPAELYSFGRCYRDWLHLPSWAPLPLYGDHGADCLAGDLAPHEINSKLQIFLTWHDKRAEYLKFKNQKKILHCPHPWIMFRRKYGLKKKESAQGTIVFLPHTVDGIEISSYNYRSYIDDLKALPSKYHPLVFCIHRHDVIKGYHSLFRDYEVPLISAGETSSPYFVDRFYSMISHFNYATSSNIGSQLHYCEEFGVSYFLKGAKPVYNNINCDQEPLGPLQLSELGRSAHQYISFLFTFPPTPSSKKVNHVDAALGLTVNKETARNQLYKELGREYMCHLFDIMKLFSLALLRSILPTKIKSLLKSISVPKHP